MRFAVVILLIAVCAASGYGAWYRWVAPDWSTRDIALIDSLWIGHMPVLPEDPTNRVGDLPAAQQFGHRLFFDTRLSANGAISCATCHQPERSFTDGLTVSIAIGQTRRNAPSIVGTAYSPWHYWDGRKDSQWAQALSPLEDAAEHGSDRMSIAHLLASDELYRSQYEAIFGPLPDLSDPDRFPTHAGPIGEGVLRSAWQRMSEDDRHTVNQIFANTGKAIAAYERLMLHAPSRFDGYAQALVSGKDPAGSLTPFEARGLELFIGKAQCMQCHNGPLLTNNSFHNTGLLSRPGHLPDAGRVAGVRQVLTDEFNCKSRYSDASQQCTELEFVRIGKENVGAFRTPSLRNLQDTAPYGHAGQHTDLNAVLQHYNNAPDAMIGHNEAKPLDLWPWEISALEAFLATLAGSTTAAPEWLSPPE